MFKSHILQISSHKGSSFEDICWRPRRELNGWKILLRIYLWDLIHIEGIFCFFLRIQLFGTNTFLDWIVVLLDYLSCSEFNRFLMILWTSSQHLIDHISLLFDQLDLFHFAFYFRIPLESDCRQLLYVFYQPVNKLLHFFSWYLLCSFPLEILLGLQLFLQSVNLLLQVWVRSCISNILMNNLFDFSSPASVLHGV